MPLQVYLLLGLFELFMLLVAIGILSDVRARRDAMVAPSSAHLLNGPAPEFVAVDLRTQRKVRVNALGWPRYTMLFLSPGCVACTKLALTLRGADLHPLVVVCSSKASRCTEFLNIFDDRALVVADPEAAVSRQYAATRLPSAVCVEAGIVRAHGHPETLKALEELLSSAIVRTLEFGTNGRSTALVSSALHPNPPSFGARP
jgi:hypothetical protein